MSDFTIWHNPKCSTSRYVLQALQDAGVDLTVRDYQKQPPTVADLKSALNQLGMTPRELLRRQNTPYDDLGLGDTSLSDDALLQAMADHPLLIQRPAVFGPKGAIMARPKETIHDFLTEQQN
ncbi:arsenate reductase (glutaredoxin) [Paracoccus sp. 11-3]|uniref:Arsenate reductase n=1 Tax=Paracoccus amoyensis TaxID=2760093 RepID=A0A926GPR5_9RHOB|nr:arsenate reductase (glutaredoxin) [Paracoccus amoyensis]MBC9247730.1 arsenate reductase (glutaredoxin) [Paracoccus amoyensis]